MIWKPKKRQVGSLSLLLLLCFITTCNGWNVTDIEDKTFVFFMSTGRCGTKFMYKVFEHGNNKHAVIRFEHEKNMHKVQSQILHPALESGNIDPIREYVRDQKIPNMIYEMNKNGKHMYVDTGHQVTLGMLEHLIDFLGPRVIVVRLKRDRMKTAASFAGALHKKDPCAYSHKENHIHYCPFDKASFVKVSTKLKWSSFNLFQKYLWWVDEVEARWQWILSTRSDFKYVPIEYKDHISERYLDIISKETGISYSKHMAKKRKVNTHNKKHFTLNWMKDKSKEYDLQMKQ